VTGGINHDGGDIGITPTLALKSCSSAYTILKAISMRSKTSHGAMASAGHAARPVTRSFVCFSKQCYVGASRSFAGTDGSTLRSSSHAMENPKIF